MTKAFWSFAPTSWSEPLTYKAPAESSFSPKVMALPRREALAEAMLITASPPIPTRMRFWPGFTAPPKYWMVPLSRMVRVVELPGDSERLKLPGLPELTTRNWAVFETSTEVRDAVRPWPALKPVLKLRAWVMALPERSRELVVAVEKLPRPTVSQEPMFRTPLRWLTTTDSTSTPLGRL